MEDTDTTRSAATYAVVWVLATVVGVAVAGFGALYWVLPAYASYAQGAASGVVLRAAAPGLLLVLLGLAIWKVTSTVVLYRTLSAAFAAETAERLNTESMKSDILAVIDERLADMKQDTQRTRRLVERQGSEEAADEFDFPGN